MFLVDEESSLKKSELINWYLKEMESEIDSEAELVAKKNLIERVLYRLIHYVSMHYYSLSLFYQSSAWQGVVYLNWSSVKCLFLFKDHIIIELTKTGLKKISEDGDEPVLEEDPFLVVNPNYILED